MPGEHGLSSRFDYLFEPLDVEDSTEAEAAPSADIPSSEGTASMRMAFAAFVLATLGIVTVVAVLLVARPSASTDTKDPTEGPLEPTPLPTVVGVPAQATTVPTSPESVPVESLPPIEPAPGQEATPAAPKTSAPRRSQGAVLNTPSTRAPISVAPETRAPFPNQTPGGGRDGVGGLLGGLL